VRPISGREARRKARDRADRPEPRAVAKGAAWAKNDQVTVRAPHGPEPGMKERLRLRRLDDPHVPGQVRIQGAFEPLWG